MTGWEWSAVGLLASTKPHAWSAAGFRRWEQHAKHTLRIFGRRADEVHIFLDQYWAKYRISNRRLLHHRLGVRLAVEKFGETRWGPAEPHIVDDLGCLPGSWIDHDPHVVYMELLDEVEQEKDLIFLYGRETYDRVRAGGPGSEGWHDGAGTNTSSLSLADSRLVRRKHASYLLVRRASNRLAIGNCERPLIMRPGSQRRSGR